MADKAAPKLDNVTDSRVYTANRDIHSVHIDMVKEKLANGQDVTQRDLAWLQLESQNQILVAVGGINLQIASLDKRISLMEQREANCPVLKEYNLGGKTNKAISLGQLITAQIISFALTLTVMWFLIERAIMVTH